jgi:COP9 signalosome complex subunit 2
VDHYKELLTYVKSAVTRNYSEKSINNMLDFIEKAAEDADAYRCMEKFYALTLDIFQSTNNERLWLKTNIKLARLWLDRKDYRQLTDKLRELHKACQREDGTDDPSKGTYSLEVYSLEILMYADQRNNKRLKVGSTALFCRMHTKLTTRQALYQRALKVKSAVPHPKIMGIIRECGGKMHMSEGRRGVPRQRFTAYALQRTGKGRRATSSRVSRTTTRLDRCSESRYSNTWSSLPCYRVPTSTPLIPRKRSPTRMTPASPP